MSTSPYSSLVTPSGSNLMSNDSVRIGGVSFSEAKNVSGVLMGNATGDGVFTIAGKIETNYVHNHHPAPLYKRSTDEAERATILNWISPLNQYPYHKEALDKALQVVEHSFMKSTEFGDWISGDTKHLWCIGPPGVGKTVLSSMIVKRLQDIRDELKGNSNDTQVLYLYMKQKEQSTVEKLLGCLATQLLEQHRPLPDYVKNKWKEYKGRTSSSDKIAIMPCKETVQLVQDLLAGRPTFIIVDALDECNDGFRQMLIERLLETGDKQVNFQLFLTSRFAEDLGGAADHFKDTNVKVDKDDIYRYVDYRINHNPGLYTICKTDEEFRDNIKAKVMAKCYGLFLLACLHMDNLTAQIRKAKVREKLNNLSESLDTTYSEIMERIIAQEKEKREMATSIIAWTVHAHRSLQLGELRHALAVQTDKPDEAFDQENGPLPDQIDTLCCGLVVVNSLRGTVSLVHPTADAYFRKMKKHHFGNFDRTIALVCAIYLCIPELEQPDDVVRHMSYADELYEDPEEYSEETVPDWMRTGEMTSRFPGTIDPHKVTHNEPAGTRRLGFRKKLSLFPLTCYAAEHLGHHLRTGYPVRSRRTLYKDVVEAWRERPKRYFLVRLGWAIVHCLYMWIVRIGGCVSSSSVETQTFSLISCLLSERPKRNFILRVLYDLDLYYKDEQDGFRQYGYHGFHEPDESGMSDMSVTDESSSLEESDDSDEITADEDEEETSDICVLFDEANMSVPVTNSSTNSPSHASSDIAGSRATSPPESIRSTSLSSSVMGIEGSYGGSEASATLSTLGLSVSSEITALHLAAYMGCSMLIAQLVSQALDINAQDFYKQTALLVALRRGFPEVMVELLEHGAFIDLESEEGHSVLLFAAENNHAEVVKKIIDQSDAGFSAAQPHRIAGLHKISGLLSAAYYGNYTQLLSLLEDLETMQESLDNESAAVFQRKKSLFHKTALFLAVERDRTSSVSILLRKGVSINSRGYNGQTPIHRAASRNHIITLETLLAVPDESAVEQAIDIKDGDGRTAWTANASEDKKQVLRLLGAKGANPNVRGRWGVHTLYGAAAGGHAASVKFLLDNGVNPSIRTDFGWAPLHWAANDPAHIETVRLLLNAGADVNPLSDTWKTPLDNAKGRSDNGRIVEILEKRGAKTGRELYDSGEYQWGIY